MNANFGLLDELPAPLRDKRLKRERLAGRALGDLRAWIDGPLDHQSAVSRGGASLDDRAPAL